MSGPPSLLGVCVTVEIDESKETIMPEKFLTVRDVAESRRCTGIKRKPPARGTRPKLEPANRSVDPWLSPREAAELLLDHKTFPRTPLQVRTLSKQICAACATFMAGGSGIDCDRIGRTYRFKKSELERWCRRRSERGLAYRRD